MSGLTPEQADELTRAVERLVEAQARSTRASIAKNALDIDKRELVRGEADRAANEFFDARVAVADVIRRCTTEDVA